LTIAAKYRPSRLPKTQPTADSNLMPLTKERPWVLAALLGVVLLSVGLRLIPVLFLPSLNWDDEIFQATEPAHRLVFGYGIVAWEFPDRQPGRRRSRGVADRSYFRAVRSPRERPAQRVYGENV